MARRQRWAVETMSSREAGFTLIYHPPVQVVDALLYSLCRPVFPNADAGRLSPTINGCNQWPRNTRKNSFETKSKATGVAGRRDG